MLTLHSVLGMTHPILPGFGGMTSRWVTGLVSVSPYPVQKRTEAKHFRVLDKTRRRDYQSTFPDIVKVKKVFILGTFPYKGIYDGLHCIPCLTTAFSLVMTSWVRPSPRGAAPEVIVFRLLKSKLDTIGCLPRKRTMGGTICSCVTYSIEIWLALPNFLIK